jgi:tetratricopeptide (TPR) repeat protein
MLPRWQMLTIKKRGPRALAIVAAACLSLTACGPPGARALQKGSRLIENTNYDQAVLVLSQAVNLLTNDPPEVRATACNLLGLAYHGAGNAQKARQYYQMALALHHLPAADFNLGCLELEHSNLAAARDLLTTYTSLQKWNVDGFLKLGNVHLRLALQAPIASERSRQFDNAKKDFQSAQNLARTAEAGNDLGLIELLDKPPPSAAAISNALLKFNVALAVDPQYSPALLNRAIVYDKYLNDGRQALLAYGKYLALSPPPPYAKEVTALTNSLDRSMRFQIQLPNHETVPSAVSPEPMPGGMTFNPAKPPHPAPPVAVVETNPTPPPPKPSPAIAPSNTPPPPAPTPAPAPPPAAQSQEPLPPSTTPEPPRNADLAVAPTTPAAQGRTPPASAPPAKKTILAKINPMNWFGGKTSPAPEGASAQPANGVPVVTPLPEPEPRSAAHYIPPTVMMYQGNREEAERLRALGAAAEKESRLKDALANYQDAVKADPTYYEACLALGLAGIKAEDFTGALEPLHRAVSLNPDSADARYAYAWALAKKNYFQDAANELEKLLAQNPNEIRAHLLLGNLYARQLGQPDLARGHYSQVLETDPRNPQAPAIRSWLQSNPGH